MTSTHWEFPKKTLLQKLGLKKVEDTGVVSKIECERKAGGCWGWGGGEERWGGGGRECGMKREGWEEGR